MGFRSSVKKLLRKAGYDVIRTNQNNPLILRRLQLIINNKIDLILDVGANEGQYAMQMRRYGYKGRIISFEPLSSVFGQLEKRAQNDPQWDVVNIALGDQNTEMKINIAGNLYSSSILDMLQRHVKSAPESAYVGTETVTVRMLDSIFHEYYHTGERVYLKMDTQGYERNVIEGAYQSLACIIGIQMEMSLVPLYKGETLFAEMLDYISKKGYDLMSLEPGFSDPSTGQLLQVDGIFFRPITRRI